MKGQQLLVSLVLFVYYIQTHCVTTASSKKTNRSKTKLYSNCSKFENDEDVVTSDDFTIPLSSFKTKLKTYGLTDENGHILHLYIVHKKSIPSTIFRLKDLERLHIENSCFFPCDHRQIPSDIKCLASSLVELSISDTEIKHLPNQIGELTKLEVLKLSNTGLRSLPDAIGDLSSLVHLYLPNNNLESLPRFINNLRLLEKIILSKNPYLYSIEPLNDLPALNTLHASYCSIKVLPRNLPQLTDLYMSNNSLTTLTGIETLGYGTNNNKSFYFNRNHIRTVSPRIRQVKNLVKLNLNDNKLVALPSDVSNITKVSYLRNPFRQWH